MQERNEHDEGLYMYMNLLQ